MRPERVRKNGLGRKTKAIPIYGRSWVESSTSSGGYKVQCFQAGDFRFRVRSRFIASGMIPQATEPSRRGMGSKLKAATPRLKKPRRANTAFTGWKRVYPKMLTYRTMGAATT